MPELVDFGRVKDELGPADSMHVYPVLVRRFIWSTHDQTPCILILTNKCIYYGGSELTKNKFFRITLNDIVGVSLDHLFNWNSIKIRFNSKGIRRVVHICPFKESGDRIEADLADMKELHKLILENKKG